MTADSRVNIIGGGLCGALLAILLARRGLAVDVYERRPDPRSSSGERGRSINLALASRGLRALQRAGVSQQLEPLMLPMRGRMIHAASGGTDFQAYGRTPAECIYSIGRTALNRVLIETAGSQPGVRLFFEHSFAGLAAAGTQLAMQTPRDGTRVIGTGATIAADGAGSAVRTALAANNTLQSQQEWLDHDYKELTVPASGSQGQKFQRDALHIWPRGGFMLIALPNPDQTMTATLFLPREGPVSFAALDTPEGAREFFRREFPDAAEAMPDFIKDFAAHPQGRMATVRCDPWFVRPAEGHSILLLGDAAHAIVPFHGQGMNAAFEDCSELCDLLDSGISVNNACSRFEHSRRGSTDALAAMALENYVEMRDTVRDPAYVRRKALSVELERRFPGRFIPRYSMVMFHPEISYAAAQERGEIQARLLALLDTGQVDVAQVESIVESSLPPIRTRVTNDIA